MVMSKQALTEEDLKKLTVPQLKALCKERKITAYSKLQKSAILEKLLSSDGESLSESVAATIRLESSRVSTIIERTPGYQGSPGLCNEPVVIIDRAHERHQPSLVPITLSQSVEFLDRSKNVHSRRKPDQNSFTPPLNAVRPEPIKLSVRKRMAKPLNSDVSSKKTKLYAVSPRYIPLGQSSYRLTGTPAITRTTSSQQQETMLPGTSASIEKSTLQSTIARHAVLTSSLSCLTVPKSGGTTVASKVSNTSVVTQEPRPKRFVPLVMENTRIPAHSANISAQAAPFLNEAHSPPLSWALSYLDFPALASGTLQHVTLPPSLSQRKRVTGLAIILAFVPSEDLPNLVRVSRLFRYAVYISAVHRLSWTFPGLRLAAMMKQYPPNMTNMWPYLQQRKRERIIRQRIFCDSFLGKAVGGLGRISQRLWDSPDNVKQASIAVRFLLTRLFFDVSVGGLVDSGSIIDCQELVTGEIWIVTTRSPSHTEVFYVLEATCEVIGHPSPSTKFSNNLSQPIRTTSLRADWSAYIGQRLSPSNHLQLPSLMEYLNWTNHEEYERGISKLWLAKIRNEDKVDAAKRAVAERYVLACVVGNSVSGRGMSSTDMAQTFCGLSSRLDYPKRPSKISLFLPPDHHIESLHFVSSNGTPLHPAIAVVQTPSREYYILKDNGMQVGCEEDGIPVVWMQLLGCDSVGRAL